MKKFEFPPDLDFRFLIQPPAGKHTAFRVFKVRQNPKPGETKRETVVDTSLAAINMTLKAGKFSKDQAKKEIELLVERWYREAGVRKFKVVSNSDNERALHSFWEDYKLNHRLVDPDSTFAKYRRAIEAIGDLSLYAASQKELQQRIDSRYSGNKQREIVGRLHTILVWAKRSDVKLMRAAEMEAEVRHLTKAELEQVLLNIDSDVFRLACRVARGTGARIGEMLAMKGEHIRDGGRAIFIKHQIRRNGDQALAKSKKADHPGRTVFVLPEARKLLREWIERKPEFTEDMRLNAANIIKAAAKKSFKGKDKWIKFHDLRHSYAIELAQSGVSLLQISQQLGNTERVCQKHYIGFVPTIESLQLIEARLKEAAKLRKVS